MSDSETTPLALTSTVQARTGLLASDLSDTESVMLDMDSGAYFGVESVAKTIWDAIAEQRQVAEVCSLVAEKYETAEADVEADTLEFIGQLVSAGLATIGE